MSSTGIVRILMPIVSLSLYQTTEDDKPVPVSIPFTMKNGNRRISHVLYKLPNHVCRKINLAKKRSSEKLINVVAL
jgi:hypothetical protein